MPRLLSLYLLILLLLVPCRDAFAAEDLWPGLQIDAFGTKDMVTDSGVVKLEAPYRAEDAAVVPMTIILAARPPAASVRKVTLVIDQNPAPVAAVFTLGEKAGVTRISTRVRVNSYTKVHAVAETSDGKLHVIEKFVKASGGCSAPAAKDPAEAKANMGKMKLRQFAQDGRQEIQLMMRHPNHSGFQMDQLTQLYTPAMFVRELTIRQGDDLLLSVEGGSPYRKTPIFASIMCRMAVINFMLMRSTQTSIASPESFLSNWSVNRQRYGVEDPRYSADWLWLHLASAGSDLE